MHPPTSTSRKAAPSAPSLDVQFSLAARGRVSLLLLLLPLLPSQAGVLSGRGVGGGAAGNKEWLGVVGVGGCHFLRPTYVGFLMNVLLCYMNMRSWTDECRINELTLSTNFRTSMMKTPPNCKNRSVKLKRQRLTALVYVSSFTLAGCYAATPLCQF